MNDDDDKPITKSDHFFSFQNFWRKLCYNLGHSWSCEPEVKVVTCIPIDVSQLQERIQTLEWELANKKRRAKESAAPEVRASLIKQIFKPLSSQAPHLIFNEFPLLDDIKEDPEMERSQLHNAENLVPITNSKIATANYCTVQETNQPPSVCRRKVKNPKVCKDQEYLLSGPLKINNEIKIERKALESKKVKKSNEHKKSNINNRHTPPHLIYYAQTVGSPFGNSGPCNQPPTYQRDCESISHAYLEEMIRKQYKPEPLINQSYSQFSTPVCREMNGHCRNGCSYDSDLCSCCPGKFQNIDHALRARIQNRLQDPLLKCMYSLKKDTVNKYYNSNDYDIVPVKEPPISKKLNRKEPREAMDVMCCPENIRIKPKYCHWLENHRTIASSKIHYLQDPAINDYQSNLSKGAVKHSRKLITAKINTATESIIIPHNQRESHNTQLAAQTPEIKPILQKNVGCITLDCNNIDCQTITTKSIQLDAVPIRDINNKTEATLGQIKSILQTVLNEVKNNQIKNTSEEKAKRDAVVNKEYSQNTMPSSTKSIQNCTNSPYNMCPYMPSYSYPYQLHSGSLCCPSMPFANFKYLQNYPLLVETPQRIYNSNYRQPKVSRSVYTINATDVTTNTESDNNVRNRETNKLIEDIYKSLAIDLENPSNDVTYNKPLKKKSELILRSPNTEACAMDNISLFNNNDKDDEAPTNSAIVNNDVHNIDISRLDMRKPSNTHIEYKISKLQDIVTHCNDKPLERVQSNNKQLTINFKRSDDDVTLTAYSETSESENESEEALSIVKSIKKKQKKGLFSKMFNSIKIFRMKEVNKNARDSESESECESDNSEDYETIIVEPKKLKKPRVTIDNKGNPKRMYREVETNPKIASSPNKREYRQHWEEKWIPHNESTAIYHTAHDKYPVIIGRSVHKLSQYSEADNTPMHYYKPHPVTYNSPNIRSEKKHGNSKDFSKRKAWLKKKNCFKCAPEWKKLMMS